MSPGSSLPLPLNWSKGRYILQARPVIHGGRWHEWSSVPCTKESKFTLSDLEKGSNCDRYWPAENRDVSCGLRPCNTVRLSSDRCQSRTFEDGRRLEHTVEFLDEFYGGAREVASRWIVRDSDRLDHCCSSAHDDPQLAETCCYLSHMGAQWTIRFECRWVFLDNNGLPNRGTEIEATGSLLSRERHSDSHNGQSQRSGTVFLPRRIRLWRIGASDCELWMFSGLLSALLFPDNRDVVVQCAAGVGGPQLLPLSMKVNRNGSRSSIMVERIVDSGVYQQEKCLDPGLHTSSAFFCKCSVRFRGGCCSGLPTAPSIVYSAMDHQQNKRCSSLFHQRDCSSNVCLQASIDVAVVGWNPNRSDITRTLAAGEWSQTAGKMADKESMMARGIQSFAHDHHVCLRFWNLFQTNRSPRPKRMHSALWPVIDQDSYPIQWMIGYSTACA